MLSHLRASPCPCSVLLVQPGSRPLPLLSPNTRTARAQLNLDHSLPHTKLTQTHTVSCRPYFLPCAVTACISAAALSSALFFVSETLPRLAAKRYAKLGSEAKPDAQGSLEMGSITPRFGAQEPFGASPIAGPLTVRVQRQGLGLPVGPC